MIKEANVSQLALAPDMQVKPLLLHQTGGVEDARNVTGIGETSQLAPLWFTWEHKIMGTVVPKPGH